MILQDEKNKVANINKIVLKLANLLSLSVWEIETKMCEAEIIDYWYAHLENSGVKFKTWKQEAKDDGFTDSQIIQYENAMGVF